MKKGPMGVLVFIAIFIAIMVASATLSPKTPAQPTPSPVAERWATVLIGPMPVFVSEGGLLNTFAVLQAGDRIRVLGRAGNFLVVGLDDGRKAVMQPLIGGEPATSLMGRWVDLPVVDFP